MEKYDNLKLSNQLCFPLYVASKEIVRRYTPYLSELELTYTQYITMMVMWEYKKIDSKELGKKLFLDSGTLTPVLKTLQEKGYIERKRSVDDERKLDLFITKKGDELKEKACLIPEKMSGCINLDKNEAMELYRLLYKIIC